MGEGTGVRFRAGGRLDPHPPISYARCLPRRCGGGRGLHFMDSIRTIGVVGAGTMGHGIAQVAAQSGYKVTLVDAVPAALERGRTQIGKGLERLVAKGKLAAEDRDQALGRLTTGGDLAALDGTVLAA